MILDVKIFQYLYKNHHIRIRKTREWTLELETTIFCMWIDNEYWEYSVNSLRDARLLCMSRIDTTYLYEIPPPDYSEQIKQCEELLKKLKEKI